MAAKGISARATQHTVGVLASNHRTGMYTSLLVVFKFSLLQLRRLGESVVVMSELHMFCGDFACWQLHVSSLEPSPFSIPTGGARIDLVFEIRQDRHHEMRSESGTVRKVYLQSVQSHHR